MHAGLCVVEVVGSERQTRKVLVRNLKLLVHRVPRVGRLDLRVPWLRTCRLLSFLDSLHFKFANHGGDERAALVSVDLLAALAVRPFRETRTVLGEVRRFIVGLGLPTIFVIR